MSKRALSTLAAAVALAALTAGPAAAQAPPAPDWVEPAAGAPSDPPCQGMDRSSRAQSEPGAQGELAADLATSTDYGVGNEVTAHHTQHGSCA